MFPDPRQTINQAKSISKDCGCEAATLPNLLAVMKMHPASKDRSFFP